MLVVLTHLSYDALYWAHSLPSFRTGTSCGISFPPSPSQRKEDNLGHSKRNEHTNANVWVEKIQQSPGLQCTEALSSAESFKPVVNSARMTSSDRSGDIQMEMAAANSIAISRKHGDADGGWGSEEAFSLPDRRARRHIYGVWRSDRCAL